MKNEIINAIFAEWTNHDFNKVSRETIDTVIQLLTDQLHLAAVKDQLLLEENIMKIACICEEVAFKSGFQMCIDLFTGKLLTQDTTEEV